MNQLVLFDYQQLDAETRIVVQQRTSEIKALMKRTAQDIIEIGEKLIDVKERLGHGNFGGWLEVEFSWTDRTARSYMQVAETFKTENFSDLNFAPSALYLLAAPSTPDEARQEAIERAERGETITHSRAKEIVAEHRPAPAPSSQVAFESVQPAPAMEIVEDGDAAVARAIAEMRKILPDPSGTSIPPQLLKPVEVLEAEAAEAEPIPAWLQDDDAGEDASDETQQEEQDDDSGQEPAQAVPSQPQEPVRPVEPAAPVVPPPPPVPAPSTSSGAPLPPPPPPVVREAAYHLSITARADGPALVTIMQGIEPRPWLPKAVAAKVIEALWQKVEPDAEPVVVSDGDGKEWLEA